VLSRQRCTWFVSHVHHGYNSHARDLVDWQIFTHNACVAKAGDCTNRTKQLKIYIRHADVANAAPLYLYHVCSGDGCWWALSFVSYPANMTRGTVTIDNKDTKHIINLWVFPCIHHIAIWQLMKCQGYSKQTTHRVVDTGVESEYIVWRSVRGITMVVVMYSWLYYCCCCCWVLSTGLCQILPTGGLLCIFRSGLRGVILLAMLRHRTQLGTNVEFVFHFGHCTTGFSPRALLEANDSCCLRDGGTVRCLLQVWWLG
jgi:hypothetical protein